MLSKAASANILHKTKHCTIFCPMVHEPKRIKALKVEIIDQIWFNNLAQIVKCYEYTTSIYAIYNASIITHKKQWIVSAVSGSLPLVMPILRNPFSGLIQTAEWVS